MTLDELIQYLQEYRAANPSQGELLVTVESKQGLSTPIERTLTVTEEMPGYYTLLFAEGGEANGRLTKALSCDLCGQRTPAICQYCHDQRCAEEAAGEDW